MAKLSGKLSVLMPAYNEEAIIYENALEAARQICPLADDYELLVIDDGWFGRRDTDNCSLGDWTVDRRKLPGGLEAVYENVRKNGMQLGIWFEPEMVSPDSDLYRAHPD